MMTEAIPQGLEIKPFERPAGYGLVGVMGDDELPVNQMNVRFDRTESAIQRVEQRARVLVIIMRMRVNQRRRLRCAAGAKQQKRHKCESSSHGFSQAFLSRRKT